MCKIVQILWFSNSAIYVPTRSYAQGQEDFFQGEFTTDDLALDHLPSLRSVSVDLICGKGKVDQEMEMKSKEKLRQQADAHPNHPSVY
jgi:disease resistance protein RPM1